MTEKMFIHIQKKTAFTEDLQQKYTNSIVFIKDTQEIWTHGTFYAIPEEYKNKITSLESAIEALQAIKAFSKISDGEHVAESPSSSGTIVFTGSGATKVTVGTGGVTITSTDEKVTAADKHYVPSGGSALTATNTSKNPGQQVTLISGITKDKAGHIVSATSNSFTIPQDTHYEAKNVVGNASTSTGSTATTNDTTFINLVENGAVRSSIQLTGSGKVNVTANSTGKITVEGLKATVATGSTNGSISVDGQQVSVAGLKSAAYADTTQFATAEQGTKANSAVQSVKINEGANLNIGGNVNLPAYPTATTITGIIPISKGGTGATTAEVARTNLELGTAATADVTTGNIESQDGASVARVEDIKDYVTEKLGNLSGALVFKGTVGTDGTVTELPSEDVNVGDTYVVKTAGNYAEEECEAGDLIIATSALPEWSVIQRNLDGAVTGKNLTANQVVVGNGNSTVKTLAPGTTSQFLRGDGAWATPRKTTYIFSDGSDGSFTVTPSNGERQTVSIGKPSTAGTADKVGNKIVIATNSAEMDFDGSASLMVLFTDGDGGFNMNIGGKETSVSIGKPGTAGTADKVANALTINLNGSLGATFNGSEVKTLNITASSIGAAAQEHTHTADKITTMKGYSKPSTVGNISASDTLNEAIGKLEALWDWKEL